MDLLLISVALNGKAKNKIQTFSGPTHLKYRISAKRFGFYLSLDFLRHSHASLLIEMGCQPLLIADRLGHEKIQTTLNTYSHLYPNKQTEVAQQLENIINGITVPDSNPMASVANL